MAIDGLIAELSGLGVVLRIEGDRLAFDAPAGVITGDLLGRMKSDRDGLMAALSGVPVDSVAADPVAEPVDSGGDHDGVADSRPKVVHLKRGDFDPHNPAHVRIDRQTKWGNRFVIDKPGRPADGDRAEVIRKYRAWVVGQSELMAALPELRGKVMGCWCAPAACHGDVLADLVDRFNERAAIREYDGGLSRADAERLAVADLMAPVNRTDDPGPIDDPAEPVAVADPVVATSIRCPSCESIDLGDDPDGLRCGSCGVLSWVITAEGGLARRDVADSVIELVDPDLVPICPSCGRWADVMTAAESWHCSRCDPKADERRRRTVRVLAFASRGRLRSVGCDGRPNKKTAYRREMPGCMIAFDDPVPGVPCERCRSVMSHLIPVHAGMSLRRDCSGCGRFVENPVWYDAAAARDLLAGLKT